MGQDPPALERKGKRVMTKLSGNELGEDAVGKLASVGAMLGFAAALFRRPLDSGQRRFLAGLEFDATDFLLKQKDCRMGLLGMVRFCSSGSEEVVLHAAGVEFHKLFVGPHHVLCPPWGSVYLDGGRLFGPTSLEVAAFFEHQGFVIPEGRREPSDHVAYELSFVSECDMRIAFGAAGGCGNANAGQVEACDGSSGCDGAPDAGNDAVALAKECQAFVVRYLQPWFGDFAAMVRSEDGTGFYAALVELVGGLLELECALLSKIGG